MRIRITPPFPVHGIVHAMAAFVQDEDGSFIEIGQEHPMHKKTIGYLTVYL
jgi:hypothetical protein